MEFSVRNQLIGIHAAIAAMNAKLDRVLVLLTQESTQMTAMDDNISKLTADVQSEGTVIQSAVTLITGFQAALQSAIAAAQAQGATTTQLQSITGLAASVEAQTTLLANAVAQGTSAAQEAPPAAAGPAPTGTVIPTTVQDPNAGSQPGVVVTGVTPANTASPSGGTPSGGNPQGPATTAGPAAQTGSATSATSSVKP
jgi:hypothetical protein